MQPGMDSALVRIGVFVAMLASFTVHEAAHAWAADRLGDRTPRRLGRLCWSPRVHLDPVWSLLVPGLLWFLGPGWILGGARPMPLQVERLRGGWRGLALAALAGPLAQALFGLGALLLLALLLGLGLYGPESAGSGVLVQVLFWSLFLAFLQLLPVPPLDGSRWLPAVLPEGLREAFLRHQAWGFILVLVLMLPLGGFRILAEDLVAPCARWLAHAAGAGAAWTAWLETLQ